MMISENAGMYHPLPPPDGRSTSRAGHAVPVRDGDVLVHRIGRRSHGAPRFVFITAFVFLVVPAVAAMLARRLAFRMAAGIPLGPPRQHPVLIAKRLRLVLPRRRVFNVRLSWCSQPQVRVHLAAYSSAADDLATAVAILAIDFHAFPRRLGKTRHHGIWLMDVGSGSFVLANALVSREALGVPPTKERTSASSGELPGYNLVVALHSTLPLLICGTVLAVMVYAFDYQQPVEEYGVYWNFFFTLAAVCAAGQLRQDPWTQVFAPPARRPRGAPTLPDQPGIGEFIRGDTRGDSFPFAQRERRVLAPVLLVLYLMGVGVGNLSAIASWPASAVNVLRGDKASKTKHGKAGDKWAWQWLMRLGILAGWFWGAALACHSYVEPVDRSWRACRIPG